jgi:hypothetical protein
VAFSLTKDFFAQSPNPIALSVRAGIFGINDCVNNQKIYG